MFSEIFLQAFVYLVAAVVAVPLAKRLGLGSALGYILAGVIIGPYLLGLVGEHGQDVMHFAEFGVVLMLFLVGLELEPSVLWRMRVPIIGMGGSQVLLSALAIAAVAYAFGLAWQTSAAIGLSLSLSSTAIVLQSLKEKGWMKTRPGRGSFSVLLFQDVAVIPILAVLPFLAVPEIAATVADGVVTNTHGLGTEMPGWLQALLVLGIVAGIVVAGRFFMRPVFRWIAATRSQELFMAAALTLVVGITLAMEFVGLSPALGTFLAGVVLAESEFRHELEANIEPFKGLLLGLFFISVGASIDFSLLSSEALLILALVAILMVSKFVVLLIVGRIFGYGLPDNLMFAFLLAQGGEFAFLLFSFATQNRVIGPDIASILIVVVVLTMIATPLLIVFYERVVRPRFTGPLETEAEDDEIDADSSPVIVAGYGRFGQVVSRMLHAGGIATTLLDHDSGQIELTGRFGYKVFYGDASRVQLLEAAGAEEAKLLVIAIDNRVKAVKMVTSAKEFFPHLEVLARAYDRSHAYELMKAGADVVTRETFGSALMMGEEALKLLGYEEAHAYRVMRTFKMHDEEGLRKLYEVWGDDHAYGLRVRQNIEDLERVLQDDRDDAEQQYEEAWARMKKADPTPE
jgi:monovalent cation:proton antiporter-2 (CPA2) family protein